MNIFFKYLIRKYRAQFAAMLSRTLDLSNEEILIL